MPCIRFKLPPTFVLPTSFSSPPFPYRLSPSQAASSLDESITRTIVTAMKKHFGPSLRRSPSTQTQKHPEAPPRCPNTSKQALTTSPVKHLLPFFSMLYVSFQAPYLRAAKTQKPALFPLERAFL